MFVSLNEHLTVVWIWRQRIELDEANVTPKSLAGLSELMIRGW